VSDQRFRGWDQQLLDLTLAPARGRQAVEGGEAGERVPLDQDLRPRLGGRCDRFARLADSVTFGRNPDPLLLQVELLSQVVD
jgi:hypothetical protein